MFVSASNAVLRAFLAPICAVCEAPLDAPLSGAICPSCVAGVLSIAPPLCDHCGDQVALAFDLAQDTDGASPLPRLCARCRDEPSALDLARSAGVYDGPLRDMIHALKYKHRRMIAPWLAARLRREAGLVLAGADAVVPVPLHPWRQWQRGFNQADDLAMGLGLPVWRALRRHRAGPPQAGLPASARLANAEGAYRLGRRERLGRPRLRGAIVVLVDDVMTTGATLNACAAVLRDAGVAEVRAVTAARAVAIRRTARLPTRHLSTARR